ncbi:MAG: FGGY-family carbohydrate kinase [Ignisphaera sp.]|nr:FGGY-family carbohydrate kinase [Ignisphaera sp.]
MRQLFIGIDLGTSGVKIEVYDVDGNVLGVGKGSISRQTVDEWFKALKEAVPDIVRRCSDCEKHVSVTSTSGTLLGVDAYGNVLYGPSMYYERDEKAFEEVKGLASIEKLGRKGVKVDPTSPIVKMYRLKRYNPDLYNKIRWFISPTTFILYSLLHGSEAPWEEVYMDYTNALKFGLDITSNPPKWFEEVFHDLDLDLEKLPRLAPVGEYIGVARSRLAEEMNLKGAHLYQGLTDGNAAAIAGGAVDLGDVSIYTGSTTVPKAVVEEMREHPALYYHVHPIKGYLAGSATGFTGAFLSWLAEKVLGTSLDSVSEYLERVEPGSEYLVFPYGDRAPHYDSRLLPAILGLKVSEEPREIIVARVIRSAMLGITLLENYYIELFEKLFNLSIESVHVTGGTTRSKVWNKIRAAVYGKKVYIYGETIGPGIVVPFIVRNKIIASIDEVKQKFIKPVEVVEPDPTWVEIYRRYRESFAIKWLRLLDVYKA